MHFVMAFDFFHVYRHVWMAWSWEFLLNPPANAHGYIFHIKHNGKAQGTQDFDDQFSDFRVVHFLVLNDQ